MRNGRPGRNFQPSGKLANRRPLDLASRGSLASIWRSANLDIRFMNLIRKYYLATEDGGLAWDKHFTLTFSDEGLIFVQVIKQYEQAYKTEDICYIQPNDFSKVTVNGELLCTLVAKKLDELLPPGGPL